MSMALEAEGSSWRQSCGRSRRRPDGSDGATDPATPAALCCQPARRRRPLAARAHAAWQQRRRHAPPHPMAEISLDLVCACRHITAPFDAAGQLAELAAEADQLLRVMVIGRLPLERGRDLPAAPAAGPMRHSHRAMSRTLPCRAGDVGAWPDWRRCGRTARPGDGGAGNSASPAPAPPRATVAAGTGGGAAGKTADRSRPEPAATPAAEQSPSPSPFEIARLPASAECTATAGNRRGRQ